MKRWLLATLLSTTQSITLLSNSERITMQPFEIKEGHTYRHYKGGLYKIIKIAYNTEVKWIQKPEDVDDSVKLVVYQSLDANAPLGPDVWWVRPYTMFIESVVIDGIEQSRFIEVNG